MTPLHMLLAASLAANAVLRWRAWASATTPPWLKPRCRACRASACSDAVDDLRILADHRGKEAEAARRAAAGKAATHNQRADAILSAPPAVPGDACASAQVRVDDWLKGRVVR